MINSPESIFRDFLSQLPLGLLTTVCIATVLLFGAFAWFVYFKPKRRNARRTSNASTSVSSTYGESGDLPDLDFLLDASNLASEHPGAHAPVRDKDTYQVTLQNGTVVEAKEIVSILRDPRDNRLIVYMDGTGYRTLADARDARKSFVKIMQELSEVIAEEDHPTVEVEASPAPESQPAPEPTKPRTPPPPVSADGKMPGDLPTYSLEDSMIPQSGGKYQPAPVPEIDIAGSIEAYLQHKLKHTPEYAGHEIHVRAAPGGGVRIEVDNSFYEAVSDVADTEIRDFLASTIEEWQERQ